MKIIHQLGLYIFLGAFFLFLSVFFMSEYKLTEGIVKETMKPEHFEVLSPGLEHMYGKTYSSNIAFLSDVKTAINGVNDQFKANQEWDKVIWDKYDFSLAMNATRGLIKEKNDLLFFLTFVLACIGGLIYILPNIILKGPAGIKNDNIMRDPLNSRGWLGIALGIFLVVFYVTLYFYHEYMTNWVLLAAPAKHIFSSGAPSQWFLYGFIYTLLVLVMGFKYIVKYRHSGYQLIRTVSVMFFQLGFAFVLPEILATLQVPSDASANATMVAVPAVDLKNIWPLDYSLFYDYRMDAYTASNLGTAMLFWSIGLIFLGVPLITYFFGKRWYCSWVCGCGGLAETAGDPFRHLSDKRLGAWKFERYFIHGILVFAVINTGVVVYGRAFDTNTIAGLDIYTFFQQPYGFFVASIFAGVIGTGFYPILGSRPWCRFACPLAAYLGLVQRFKSKFRITTNGGQCISCGNCSTYCEMGIDVRWYAQRGQNIVRSSCVGCGVCSAVCPRGVLNLENGPEAGRLNGPEMHKEYDKSYKVEEHE